MTLLEQIGQLGRDILDKGVPDTYQMPVRSDCRRVYFSPGALDLVGLLTDVPLYVLVFGIFMIHDARIIFCLSCSFRP